MITITKPQLIIAIMSCKKHRTNRQKAIRNTWFKDIPPNIQVFFIEGGHKAPSRIDGDNIYLECSDKWDDLAVKVHKFYQFCLTNLDFQFIFKCDDDTYVNVDRLMKCGFERHEYMGNLPPGKTYYAQGGAYFLSKSSVELIATTHFTSGKRRRWWWGGESYNHRKYGLVKNACIEDMMVGSILNEKGVRLHMDERFQNEAYPSPYDNDWQITSHHVDENEMYQIHGRKTQL